MPTDHPPPYPGRMLKPSLPLHTPRLTLRPFTHHDLQALHAIHSLPQVARYLYWTARDLEQTAQALETKIGQSELRAEGQALSLAIDLTATGELIGEGVLIWHSLPHRAGEIGYILHPRHHGRGYATEAAEVLLTLGFDDLGLHRITGRLDGRNTASARVLQRLGMRREAHLVENEMVKGEWTDEVIYAILSREWRARHPADTTPAPVFHLAAATDWETAQASGEYRVSTLGRTLEQEGFIHACSSHDQIQRTARRFYTGLTTPLLLLTVDPTGLDVRLETPAGHDEPFPHIYGPLPVTSVVSAVPFTAPAHP
ncbi:hypothetical protein GCM10017673_30070 [Streptosporangium violaceochromogenes]|nr:hypothetical protein GCM10017673_30070 [Streptosporangium violaceochromogenes]